MVFILLGNIAHSLKFELISCKIGLVSFSRWNLIHMNCFIAKLMTATTVMTNCAMFQKRIKLHESIYRFQSSVFWSFICIFKSNLHVHNHVSQKAKGEISNRDAIPNRETAIQVQAMFPTKNTLTIDTNDQKFNCDNANGHSQTGNWKKISASWISKTSHKNKSNEKRLETLFPRHWSNIYLHKTSFNCGFDRYKVIDCFKVQLVNWWLLLFQWCKMPFKHFYSHFDAKYHPSHVNRCKFPEELSTDTVSWICILQEFLPRIKQWVDFIIL